LSDQFAGDALEKKGNQWHFIITSASTICRDYSSRIILIDGSQLAGYMIDHGVGVSITSTYEIKKIDSDFFEEDIE